MNVALTPPPTSQARACTLKAHEHSARDTSRPIMLIGFQEQSNLGLGYLSAVLKRHGYRVDVFDFDQDPAVIVEHARSSNPVPTAGLSTRSSMMIGPRWSPDRSDRFEGPKTASTSDSRAIARAKRPRLDLRRS